MRAKSGARSGRFAACALLGALGATVRAGTDDWPTYMHDAARSGVSSATLAAPLVEQWSYTPPTAPQPAWPDPQTGWTELPKLKFDDATHVALVGDAVYFGSPVDHGIHAVDAATGARRWTYFTGAPVRLAPTVADGRVYAGSDDGGVYCLAATNGRLLWSARLFPDAARVLGAGRLMSPWPVRTGVVVADGVAYCGAGVFPALGTAVAALDAKDGSVRWKTSEFPRKQAYVALSPQGYLLASREQLFVPCGRTAPLSYALADGAVRAAMEKAYEIVPDKGVVSGVYGVLIDDLYFVGTQNVLHGYRGDGRHAAVCKDTRRLIATSNRYFRLSGQPPPQYGTRTEPRPHVLTALDRAGADAGGKGSGAKGPTLWTFTGERLEGLIAAGPHVVVGGSNRVWLLDAQTGTHVWEAAVDGAAAGLAVAHGRLLVSTDKGRLHCFGPGAPAPRSVAAAVQPFPEDAAAAATAEAFARDAAVERGYALVMAGEAGDAFNSAQGLRLAYELARRTRWFVVAAVPDAEQAERARDALQAAGLYGSNLIVEVAAGGTNPPPYPPYFANVIVADGARVASAAPAPAFVRLLKPHGGMLYLKTAPAAARGAPFHPAWAAAEGVSAGVAPAGAEGWMRLTRGRLPGARDWTHQHADAGNAGSSDDARVRGKIDLLWYGTPGADKAQDRHRRSEAPLACDGRMFMQGLRVADNRPLLLCFDAYNGVLYWEREMPGAERLYITGDCGNLACASNGLFVAIGKRCLRLDPRTGETRATYTPPPDPDGTTGAWAYVATDGEVLVGSVSAGYQFSRTVFAYDLKTDRLRWRYDGAVIRNSTLALQGGRVFFAEHRGQTTAPVVLTIAQKAKAGQAKRRRAAAESLKSKTQDQASPSPDAEAGPDAEAAPDTPEAPPARDRQAPYVRTIVALDLATGQEVWARDADLTACGAWIERLTLIAKNDVVLLCGAYSAYGRAKGDEEQRRALALSARDGATLWNEAIGNYVRPVVVGDTIIARPHAFHLRTGQPVMRTGAKGAVPWAMQNSGACGEISASAGLLFFRDGYTVAVDAATGGRTMTFIGLRPGCLINIIPAGGVVVQAENSSGCMCYHAVQATVAFVPRAAPP